MGQERLIARARGRGHRPCRAQKIDARGLLLTLAAVQQTYRLHLVTSVTNLHRSHRPLAAQDGWSGARNCFGFAAIGVVDSGAQPKVACTLRTCPPVSRGLSSKRGFDDPDMWSSLSSRSCRGLLHRLQLGETLSRVGLSILGRFDQAATDSGPIVSKAFEVLELSDTGHAHLTHFTANASVRVVTTPTTESDALLLSGWIVSKLLTFAGHSLQRRNKGTRLTPGY